jgi:hypothetical protein
MGIKAFQQISKVRKMIERERKERERERERERDSVVGEVLENLKGTCSVPARI